MAEHRLGLAWRRKEHVGNRRRWRDPSASRLAALIGHHTLALVLVGQYASKGAAHDVRHIRMVLDFPGEAVPVVDGAMLVQMPAPVLRQPWRLLVGSRAAHLSEPTIGVQRVSRWHGRHVTV